MYRIFILLFISIVACPSVQSQSKTSQKDLSRPLYTATKPLLYSALDIQSSGQKTVNKSILDSAAIKHWISVDDNKLAISNDGNYVWYKIRNKPYKSSTLIVQALSSSWRKEIMGISEGFFSGDSKQFVYVDRDTLLFLFLGSEERIEIRNIRSYHFPKTDQGQWMSYQAGKTSKRLFIHNLFDGKHYCYDHVTNYEFDETTTSLLLQTDTSEGKGSIQWFNVAKDNLHPIWSWFYRLPPLSFNVDPLHKQLCFLLPDTANNTLTYSIFYYRLGMSTPLEAVSSQSKGIESGLELTAAASPGFTKDGRYIHFWLREATLPRANPDAIQVDVWNYKDTVLQSVQLQKIINGEFNKYQCVAAVDMIENTTPVKVVRLLRENEDAPVGYAFDLIGDYFLSRERQGGDRFWESHNKYWLTDLNKGARKLICTTEVDGYFWMSPNGSYLLQYRDDRNYYCYVLKTGKIQNISEAVKVKLNHESPYFQNFNMGPIGLAGWIDNDKVLVYDDFDIWQLDMAGKQPPKNITHGYGRLNQLKIRIVEEGKVFEQGDTLLLSVFDPLKKLNGLYREILGRDNAFEKPLMGPWSIYYSRSPNQSGSETLNHLMRPTKARDVNAWVVKRESTREAPNYFLTHDFRTFHSITSLQPHAEYNWLRSELVHWKRMDGNIGQGVLFKPENFDSSKKYPLIISYYEQRSGFMYQYPKPEFSRSTNINIPWFVSHGYLVFTPDMYYVKGRKIESVCNTIISAAKSISLLPYIDSKRMGIAGFSWGGTQTNWLISQTDLFAAAATGGVGIAGSDLVSAAFQISEIRGVKRESLMRNVEDAMDGSFFNDPNRWLALSPVLRCDKVKTPLLMLQNYGDDSWQLNAEIFLGLRRLNKPVWMLQYDSGLHGVSGRDAEDFTIRLTQFFNHFLMETPEPKWMSKGIPAKLKGVVTGYEFDE